ncbi:MAG: hypothetical protein VB040_06185 [Propionibacterium sp.]|nr:hypothetical protein [Propionibacterium sp.]
MNKTTKTLDQLEAEGQQQEQAAQQARDAVSHLGLAVNGASAPVVPAPVASVLLEETGILLGYLRQMIDYLPTALARSLSDPRISVYECTRTQKFREPRPQIEEASEQMLALSAALARTVSYAEAARQAIKYQTYEEKPDAATYTAELKAARKTLADFPDSPSPDDAFSEMVRDLRRKHGIKPSRQP